jgi:hypothetical protein
MGRAFSMYGQRRAVNKFLVGKLGRPGHRWEDDIKMKVGWRHGLD